MSKRGEDFLEIHVCGELSGLRLDQVLASRMSRRMARRLIEAGAVFVDRRRVKVASRPVADGSVVRAPLFLPETAEADPSSWVVFQTPDYIVADKPAGWATTPTLRGEASVATELQKRFGRIWVVSRLDFHTSGLVPFVLNPEILQDFEALLRSDACIKEYLAVTVRCSFSSHMLDFPLAPDPRHARRFCVHPQGREARTEILEVIPVDADRQLVRLRLHTGRTHQIRVHLAHVGVPVWGDPWYPVEKPAGHPPMLLHASRLKWTSQRFGDAEFYRPPAWLDDILPYGFMDA